MIYVQTGRESAASAHTLPHPHIPYLVLVPVPQAVYHVQYTRANSVHMLFHKEGSYSVFSTTLLYVSLLIRDYGEMFSPYRPSNFIKHLHPHIQMTFIKIHLLRDPCLRAGKTRWRCVTAWMMKFCCGILTLWLSSANHRLSIYVAYQHQWSKKNIVWVIRTSISPGGCSLTGIMGSNPAGGMDVCLLWTFCVVR